MFDKTIILFGIPDQKEIWVVKNLNFQDLGHFKIAVFRGEIRDLKIERDVRDWDLKVYQKLHKIFSRPHKSLSAQ
jgi:hypothetical protein